jgi:hypothetical protein
MVTRRSDVAQVTRVDERRAATCPRRRSVLLVIPHAQQE